MRNLKRVLSLALAIVMVIGMMVIGAGAASFGDVKSITKDEAVAVMVGLEIMEGDEKGNFNPTDILTREQAAAMMARLVLGADGAEVVSKNKVGVFVDVAADRWSAGYIAWAANQGFIAGNGDGTFDPTGALTGLAYAKLLLVAMGYDATVEGYVNNTNWATNIGADAVAAGLDVKGTLLADGLTRENAAQMTLQALEADVVEYANKGTEIITADGTVIRTGVVGPFAVEATRGEQAKDYDDTDDETEDTIQLVEKLYDFKVSKDTSYASDEWGVPAEYQWKKTGVKKALYTEWATPEVEYFTAESDCDIAKELGIVKKDNAHFDIYMDGVDVVPMDAEYAIDVYEDDYDWNGTGTGVWTRIYDMGDDVYRVVAINTYLGEVTKVTAEKTDKNGHVKVEASITVDVYNSEWAELGWNDDAAAPISLVYETDDEYTKGDMVLVTVLKAEDNAQIADPGDYEITAVELADAIDVEISKYKKGDERAIDNYTVTIDGDAYATNVKWNLGYKVDTKTEYTLYLDAQGNVIGADEPDDTYIWAVIDTMEWDTDDEDDKTDGYVGATLITMDAEEMDDVILTDYRNGNDVNGDPDYVVFGYAETRTEVGTIQTWDGEDFMAVYDDSKYNKPFYAILTQFLKTDDGEYAIHDWALTAVAANGDFDGDVKAKDAENLWTGSKWIETNTKTTFLVLTNDGYETYDFKTLPEISNLAEVQFTVAQNGKYADLVFIDARKATFEGDTQYVYIIDDDADLDIWGKLATNRGFDAWADAEETEFYLNKTFTNNYAGQGLYELSFNSAGKVISIDPVATTTLNIDAVDGDVIRTTAIGDDNYEATDDTKILAIVYDDDGDFEKIEESSLTALGREIPKGGDIDIYVTLKKGDLEYVYYVTQE